MWFLCIWLHTFHGNVTVDHQKENTMKFILIIAIVIALSAWGFSGTIHRAAVAITKIVHFTDEATSTAEQAAKDAKTKAQPILDKTK